MNLKWLIIKVVAQKEFSKSCLGLVSHHLRSLLNAIELIVCVQSYAKKDIFMLKLERLYCAIKGFNLLGSLGICN